MSLFDDFTLPELLVIFGAILLLAFLLAEALDFTHVLVAYKNKACAYGYGINDGMLKYSHS